MMNGRLAAYTRDGRSPTVLLLHGVFMDHTLWDHVLELRSDVRAVALDLPGHGTSDPAGWTGLDAAMDAVTWTVTAEDAFPVVIVGHHEIALPADEVSVCRMRVRPMVDNRAAIRLATSG